MVPKIIHCVWLSGDKKPKLHLDCLASWKKNMPDYKIMEWSLTNLPPEILNHKFVAGAIKERKWAYATDLIRLWALFNYGGIYMDLDVYVFKSFDPFLKNNFFSSIELDPRYLYRTISKREVIGCGIEAAVMGSVKNHPLIGDILDYYKDLEFINTPEFHFKIIMPRVITRVAIAKYGFRQVPNYQILKEDVHLYPCDVFSSVYDWQTLGCNSFDEAIEKLEGDPVRYSCHLCAHSWYEGEVSTNSIWWKIKHLLYKLTLAKYWKTKFQL